MSPLTPGELAQLAGLVTDRLRKLSTLGWADDTRRELAQALSDVQIIGGRLSELEGAASGTPIYRRGAIGEPTPVEYANPLRGVVIVRPDWESFLAAMTPAGAVFCNGCRTSLTTIEQIRHHWQVGHFDAAVPCVPSPPPAALEGTLEKLAGSRREVQAVRLALSSLISNPEHDWPGNTREVVNDASDLLRGVATNMTAVGDELGHVLGGSGG
jgi:hypothetical protein